MTIFFSVKNLFVRFCFLITVLALAHSQNGFAQHSSSLPGEVKKTIDDFMQKGNESENANDFNQASFFYHQAGNTYWTNGCFPEAIELLKKSLSMSERISNLNGIAVLNTKIGLLYSEVKDYKNSLTFFTQSLAISRKMDRKQDQASSLLNIANSYTELEQYNESIPFFTEAEALAKDLADTKLLRNCYSLMARVYDKVGDREKSSQYFNLFAAITKRIQQDEMTRKESEARLMVDKANSRVIEVEQVKEATEQELKEKDQELHTNQINLSKVEQISKEQQMQIDLLSKEKELQQAQIRQQQLMRNVYLGIIVAVLMISGLTLYGYSKIKRANILLSIKNIEISLQKDEIEKQAVDLRELNALKDKLFSIIAHDLRSPLFSLVTMLTMVKDGSFSAEEEKHIFNELSKNVEYNTELLENLLNWSSSQMKGNAINPITFGIHELTSNKINLYEEAANQKGIKLINSTNINTEVFADKDMIELVLRNLITNAIKFSKNGDKITISSTVSRDSVEVCVADNGMGISQEVIGKLFGKNVFTTRGTLNEKGTGLGLILCRDFVHINGGRIWVDSIESKGSKFFFTLPSRKS